MEDLNPPISTHLLNEYVDGTEDLLGTSYLTCIISSDLNNNIVR